MRSMRRVAYTGPDIPEISVWHGHPGVVLDVLDDAGAEPEIVVDLVGSVSLCLPEDEVVVIEDATYLARGERVLASKHPIDEVGIGPPLTAEGSHWPDRQSSSGLADSGSRTRRRWIGSRFLESWHYRQVQRRHLTRIGSARDERDE